MATETFTFSYNASADVYVRIFDSAGLCFDFDDSTFKAIASCTTPYAAATERTAGGTANSIYQVAVDLDTVNGTGAANRYTMLAYDNATPADADDPVSAALDLPIRFGTLSEQPAICQGELNVKSTAGTTAQLTGWLEFNGAKVSVGSVGGSVFTADAGTDVITSASHGLSDTNAILLTTSDTLPAPLATATPYYVRDSTASTFKVAATSGGAAIDITDAGTGTHKWHYVTATFQVREHGSGSLLFTATADASDLNADEFEVEQSSPGFTDDREYELRVTIVENGVTHGPTTHSRVIFG